MTARNLFTSILNGKADTDQLADADRWIDESLDLIDFNEEPTLIAWLATDTDAVRAFKATMAAIYTTLITEAEKGSGASDTTKQIEILVSRLIAACCHKAMMIERARYDKNYLFN